MPAKKNKSYTAEFKAKVALDAIKGDLTINEISSKYGVHSTQINRWKQQALASLKTCFNGKQEKASLDSQQPLRGMESGTRGRVDKVGVAESAAPRI